MIVAKETETKQLTFDIRAVFNRDHLNLEVFRAAAAVPRVRKYIDEPLIGSQLRPLKFPFLMEEGG